MGAMPTFDLETDTGYPLYHEGDAPEPELEEESHPDGQIVSMNDEGRVEIASFGGRRSRTDPMWIGHEPRGGVSQALWWAGFIPHREGDRLFYTFGEDPEVLS